MKEVKGDIWDYHDKGHWIVIPTNGSIREDGACVMGRGVALQAKQRFPNLPHQLGELIRERGNRLFAFPKYRIITYPVKHNWREKADIVLIEKSCQSLAQSSGPEFCMVRPGCGNGRLNWKDVKPILEKYLDDRFVVVNPD